MNGGMGNIVFRFAQMVAPFEKTRRPQKVGSRI